jgi:uncharacterized membrane protein YeaQ/YmgE (transglycosylase-associated protein family)
MVDPVSLIISLIIMILGGALAGWAVGQIVEGHDHGFWTIAIIGIAGAILFYWPLYPLILGAFLGALVGMIVLLFIVKLIKRCTSHLKPSECLLYMVRHTLSTL